MVFFNKGISIKVAEPIVNPIILFSANFKALKMKVNRIEKIRSDGCCK